MKKTILILAIFFGNLGAIGYYDCGLYGSVQAGWARLVTPLCNDLETDDYAGYRTHDIEGTRGRTAWGADIGYHYPYCANILVSFEAGYHDNGFSEITFKNCNQYRIESTDVEVLGAVTYVWRPGVWFSVKGGGAKVRQIYRIWHVAENFDIDDTAVLKKWAPTTSLAAGISFCGLEFFVMYRYVFAGNLTNMSDAFTFKEDEYYNVTLAPCQVAKLHSIYAGIQASLY